MGLGVIGRLLRCGLGIMVSNNGDKLLSYVGKITSKFSPPKARSGRSLALMMFLSSETMANGITRKRLFSMINDLPTVFEVVSDRRQQKDKAGNDTGNKSKLSTKRSNDGQVKNNSKTVDEGYGEEEDDEHSETLCGTCGGNYNADEFWIGCDVCERWYHGKCVKITPAKAESIKQYKCPSCSSKKGRQ